MLDDLNRIIKTMKPTWDKHTDQVFVKDANLRYVYVNSTYLQDTGLTQEEILGKTGHEIFNDNDSGNLKLKEKFHLADLEILKNGEMKEYEAVFNLFGEDYYSLTQKSPLYNSDGNIIGILGVSRNMLSVVNTRSRLKENLALLETLMDTVPFPIFVKDLQLRYIKVNQALLDELSLEESEILSHTDTEVFTPENAKMFIEKDNFVLATGNRISYLVNWKEQNKTTFTIKEPLRNSDGQIFGIVGVINPYVDIAELREDILNHQKIESIATLTAGIAHDLNNILTSVMGVSSMMMTGEEEFHNEEMVKIIYQASIDGADLIKKLLTFSKQSPRKIIDLDIISEVKTVIALVKRNLKPDISVNEYYLHESLYICADKTNMSQLVLNLIMNANDAIKENGKIDVKVEKINIKEIDPIDYVLHPTSFTSGEFVKITVSDSGRGMSKRQLDKAFEPFYTTKEQGVGLGLSVVFGIVASHEGLLQVESELDEGTTFTIYFPFGDNQVYAGVEEEV